MKIVKALPPNYEEICKVFPVRDKRAVCFVYGDTLYRPGGDGPISYDLRVHEETHVRQQEKMGASLWWHNYIVDPAFRFWQEVEAYHNQYMAMSKPDRERHIRRLAGDLSGPMYQLSISFNEAKRLIRTGLA